MDILIASIAHGGILVTNNLDHFKQPNKRNKKEYGGTFVTFKKEDLLKELKGNLAEIYGKNLSGVYLYGSYARRQQNHESDVDIVIVLKNFNDYWEEIKRTSPVISRLSLKYNTSISPIRVLEKEWDQANSPFLNIVRRESVPV